MPEIIFREPFAGIISKLADALNGDTAGPPDAITFGQLTIYLVTDPSDALRRHEAKHREQALRYRPWWALGPLRSWGNRISEARFLVASLKEHQKNSYINNKFEVEARNAEGQAG